MTYRTHVILDNEDNICLLSHKVSNMKSKFEHLEILARNFYVVGVNFIYKWCKKLDSNSH